MKKILLLYMTVLFCLLAYSQEPTFVKGDKYEGYIFDKEHFVFLSIDNQQGRYTPSEDNIEQCEDILKRNLGNYMINNQISPSSIPIYRILPHYKRQYVGFITKDNEIVIWINFLRYSYTDLSKDIIWVKDGGSNFWSIFINLTKKELYNMEVNGEA